MSFSIKPYNPLVNSRQETEETEKTEKTEKTEETEKTEKIPSDIKIGSNHGIAIRIPSSFVDD
jgi:hypothetical protein